MVRLLRQMSSQLCHDHHEGLPDEDFVDAGSIAHSVGASPRISKFPRRQPQSIRITERGEPRPWISFIVVYTMIFFNGCCFTAVVPSVPFYLQILEAPPSFLGWVVSFYSLGQIFGSPIGGWLADKVSSRCLLTISSTLGFLSSIIYSVAPAYMFILWARLLTGMSAGMEFSVELTFIAKNTTKKERTVFLASVTAVNVVGFIMGPALGGLIAMMDFTIGGISINQYTGPGWLLAVMFIVDIIMVQTLFQDTALAESIGAEAASAIKAAAEDEKSGLLEEEKGHDSYGGVETDLEEACQLLNKNVRTSMRPPALDLVLGLIFVQFTVMCAWSVLETITSPLAQDHFSWDVPQCNLLFTGGGVVSLIAYVCFVVASKWVQDRWLIVGALITCVVGQVLAIDWQLLPWVPRAFSALLGPYLPRFLVGYALMNAGFMTARPVTFALYSKLIGSEYQGKYLGWMVAGGSLARTVGPFVAVAIYYQIEVSGINLLILFGMVGSFHLICLVLVIVQWRILLPKAQASIRSVSNSERLYMNSLMNKNEGNGEFPPGKHVVLSFREPISNVTDEEKAENL